MPPRFPLIFLLTAASAFPAFAETRPWKSADGMKTVQGDFVKRDAATVTIRLDSGKETTIELTKLHADETKWLNANHSLTPVGNGDPDPAAVFDTLLFGDSRETVEKKLKASKIVEMTTDEAFLGRSGLNGVFFTRQKIGKVKASLYFDWTDDGSLKELTLQTELLPDTAYKSDLEPTWTAMVELLSTLYGQPVQKGPMPAMSSLSDGTFSPSHLWALESGGGALLGTARDGKKYQLVVRFTQKKIQQVEVP
ncbi:MAG: hypothetical protein ABIS50_08565 [Luteolibacter sp.]|uniref:hypothetical protein n=1 Tax=Luteolibacter sp. TaxID=1962973 RepID=UPI0032652B91